MADELMETPQAEEANEQVEEAIETIKEETDKRDDAILEELRNIHNAINAQTEHHIRHLEQHTLSSQAPTQQVAEDVATPDKEEETSQEPVSLQIDEPSDMVKEEKKEEKKKRKKAHGRKR